MMRRRVLLGASIPVALTLGHRVRAADSLRLAVAQLAMGKGIGEGIRNFKKSISGD